MSTQLEPALEELPAPDVPSPAESAGEIVQYHDIDGNLTDANDADIVGVRVQDVTNVHGDVTVRIYDGVTAGNPDAEKLVYEAAFTISANDETVYDLFRGAPISCFTFPVWTVSGSVGGMGINLAIYVQRLQIRP